MLTQLVRPLVRSQVQMLAQTQSAGAKLVSMVSQWLGYLGVHAEVTHLRADGDRIRVSLCVGKPEQCTEDEWRKILASLTQGVSSGESEPVIAYQAMTSAQRGKVHRLLACVLRASSEDFLNEWEDLRPQLKVIGLSEPMLAEIRSAARVPTSIELLVENLEPEVAAFALSKAISIALMDTQINQAEDNALKALLNALEQESAI